MNSFENLFQPDQTSTSEETRIAYSRDASRIRGTCLGVAWPKTVGDVVRLAQWAAETQTDLVPRGAGTGLCGGASPQDSIVVDSSRLRQIHWGDPQMKTVRVDAGIPLDALNRALQPYEMFFPVIPGSHRSATIGGMIATDAAGLHAVRYGRMRDWVEEVVLVDGNGEIRHFSAGDLNSCVGREGVTGMIVEATLRMTEIPEILSLTLFSFEGLDTMLNKVEQLKENPALSALEYLNPNASLQVGWAAKHHILAEFHTQEGALQDSNEIRKVWAARESLSARLTLAGFPISEDPQFPFEALETNLDWLSAQGVAVFGHLGLGILHPRFLPNDPRIEDLYHRVSIAGGQISGEHGLGLKKRLWAGEEIKANIQTLKTRLDPLQIFNRGKLC